MLSMPNQLSRFLFNRKYELYKTYNLIILQDQNNQLQVNVFDNVLLFVVYCSLYKLYHINVAGKNKGKGKLHIFPHFPKRSFAIVKTGNL